MSIVLVLLILTGFIELNECQIKGKDHCFRVYANAKIAEEIIRTLPGTELISCQEECEITKKCKGVVMDVNKDCKLTAVNSFESDLKEDRESTFYEVIPCSLERHNYTGCYDVEQGTGSFSMASGEVSITVIDCMRLCHDFDYRVAGLKKGDMSDECWCSDYRLFDHEVDNTNCNSVCEAEELQYCGGMNKMAVFAIDKDEFQPKMVVSPGDDGSASMDDTSTTSYPEDGDHSTPSPAQSGKCFEDWTPSEDNRYCYLYAPRHALSFTKASEHCEQNGAVLVKINDEEENDFMISLLDTETGVWIGYENNDKTGQFESISDQSAGHVGSYTNWAPGEPLSKFRCVSITNDGRWKTTDCGTAQAFICQKQSSNQP